MHFSGNLSRHTGLFHASFSARLSDIVKLLKIIIEIFSAFVYNVTNAVSDTELEAKEETSSRKEHT